MSTPILDCGHPPSPHSEFTTGYWVTLDDRKLCYGCCAEDDLRAMRESGKATMYLVKNSQRQWEITNWPGSLRFQVYGLSRGRHNIAGSRMDCYTELDGQVWHWTQYGEWAQLAYGRRLKHRPRWFNAMHLSASSTG